MPEYIHTVAIPTLVNKTSRFEVEIRLTDAVTREFVSRGNFRVAGDEEGADAVLRGEITGFDVRPVGLGAREQAQNYQVTVRASVTFIDQVQNKVLFTNSSFLFRDEYELERDPGQFFDVEILAIDAIATEFARSVVSSILEGF
ncbi:MAG: LPS assembly lipoprotein LptE [Acidobacteriota bacterium]